jgi:hypothetical protein
VEQGEQQEQEQEQPFEVMCFVAALSLLIVNDDILHTCTKFISRLDNYLAFK